MNLRDRTPSELAILRLEAVQFADSPLWAALREHIDRDKTRILDELMDANTPAEKLKFVQGELAQASRDIMLIERFLEAIDKAQANRRLAAERRG